MTSSDLSLSHTEWPSDLNQNMIALLCSYVYFFVLIFSLGVIHKLRSCLGGRGVKIMKKLAT